MRASSCWMCWILKYWRHMICCNCFFNWPFSANRTSMWLTCVVLTNDTPVLCNTIFLKVSSWLTDAPSQLALGSSYASQLVSNGSLIPAVNGRNSLTNGVADLDAGWSFKKGTRVVDLLLHGLGDGLWNISESCCLFPCPCTLSPRGSFSSYGNHSTLLKSTVGQVLHFPQENAYNTSSYILNTYLRAYLTCLFIDCGQTYRLHFFPRTTL